MNISIAGWALMVAICSLTVSALVAYLTLLRKGKVRMTQPTTIYLGADVGRLEAVSRGQKVFLRTLLYGTAKKGNVISSLYLRLTQGETIQTFNVWVYGDDSLMRGSGLYVGEEGVVTNHHFLLPKNSNSYRFASGQYILELYVTSVEKTSSELLWRVVLDLPHHLADKMAANPFGGVYFDWQPNSRTYEAHFVDR